MVKNALWERINPKDLMYQGGGDTQGTPTLSEEVGRDLCIMNPLRYSSEMKSRDTSKQSLD